MSPKEFQIGPVRFIRGEKGGKYPACHSLYLEKAGVIIDPASDRARLKAIRDHENVTMVWLSHWHEDHIGHLDLFEAYPLWMSAADVPPLTDLAIFFNWIGIDGPEGERLRAYWRPILEEQFHYKPRKPARALSGGETIELEDVTVEVVPSPGHSPGHLAFYFREPRILFIGDVDLTPFGPWYADRFSSIEETISTVGRLRKIPAKYWITGHGTGIFEHPPGQLWDDYLAVIQRREADLVSFLSAPRSMDAIINQSIIYGKAGKLTDFHIVGERGHMEKHLERLIESGQVGVENGSYYKT